MTYQHETIFGCYFDALTKKDMIINSRDVARYEKILQMTWFYNVNSSERYIA